MPYPYNSRYYPPMPAIEVALGAPGADFSLGPLPTIVDTGADITTVPREYLVRLGAPVVASGYLRSPWGERHRVKIYEVNIMHLRLGQSLEEIAGKYDLDLADVYAAMAYYYDHRSEIDGSIEADEAFAEAFRRNNPSLLQAKLRALHSG